MEGPSRAEQECGDDDRGDRQVHGEESEGASDGEDGRDGEDHSPVDEVGEDAGRCCGTGGSDGDGGHEIGECGLTIRLVDGVADIGHRGRDDGSVERTGQGASDDEDAQCRGEGRRHACEGRGEKCPLHQANPPELVGEDPPYGLADAVGQEVGAGDRQRFGKGCAEVVGHENDERTDRETVEAGDERGQRNRQRGTRWRGRDFVGAHARLLHSEPRTTSAVDGI